MRIEWLNKKGSDRVIVFFHGWGMDAAGVSHLQMEDDVLMCYDYRSLDFAFPDLGYYRCIYVVAWSMGVWAADRVISRLEMKPERCVALNGTTRPVDDEYGIPVKIYELTEKGMNERGREKFFLRMGLTNAGNSADKNRIVESKKYAKSCVVYGSYALV